MKTSGPFEWSESWQQAVSGSTDKVFMEMKK